MSLSALKCISHLTRPFMNSFKSSIRCVAASQPSGQPALAKKEVEITFIKANGARVKAKGKIGDSLLDVVINNDLDFDGFGACEGTLTCSTCHLIFQKSTFDALPNKPTEEELDMLDLAYDLTDSSRLGCQVIVNEDFEGLEIKVPATINDARS
ncbi:adrenodoxin-like protein 2, mitochondrial [Euwallacea fornicatus]|uniref:adrenodoxin-like protein 2, mitochondrial n=1 Tax=Euwallacea fornicatus TaxID=995702 RepID=UPI00338D752B